MEDGLKGIKGYEGFIETTEAELGPWTVDGLLAEKQRLNHRISIFPQTSTSLITWNKNRKCMHGAKNS